MVRCYADRKRIESRTFALIRKVVIAQGVIQVRHRKHRLNRCTQLGACHELGSQRSISKAKSRWQTILEDKIYASGSPNMPSDRGAVLKEKGAPDSTYLYLH